MSAGCLSISHSEVQRKFALASVMPVLLCALLLTGCSALISSATVDMTAGLSKAIMNNNDLATVEAGAPAYLLMVDSLL